MRAKLRQWLGGVFSKWADWLLYGDGHRLIVRDADGVEIFNVSTSGGYVAMDPPPPYSFECCEEDFGAILLPPQDQRLQGLP